MTVMTHKLLTCEEEETMDPWIEVEKLSTLDGLDLVTTSRISIVSLSKIRGSREERQDLNNFLEEEIQMTG